MSVGDLAREVTGWILIGATVAFSVLLLHDIWKKR